MDLLSEANRLSAHLLSDLKQVLVEDKSEKKIIAVYAGEFQPFHQGHFDVFKRLQKRFGKENVYLVTGESDADEPTEPMSFKDKENIMSKIFDIPKDHIEQVENPYIPKELLTRFDPKTTAYVTVVDEDDVKLLEKTEYFEHYVEDKPLKGYKQAGYFLSEPEVRIKIGNNNFTDSQLIQILGSPKTKEETKLKILKKMFPKKDNEIFNLVKKKATVGFNKINGFKASDVTGQTADGTRFKKTDAKGQDVAAPEVLGPKNKPLMQRKIRNPLTGRAIKIQSALKYPRWKPVYKMANQVLKAAGIDRRDRTDEPEVNQRYKARAKKMTKEDIIVQLSKTLTEQLVQIAKTSGVTLNVDGIGTISLRLPSSPILVMEGGAAGHLLHPYEDTDLKFSDMQQMITRSLSGGLDKEAPVTEKLDGQNIQFSYRNGKIVFARSRSHVKNNGENALDINGVKEKFAGRGDVEASFVNATEDLQSAIDRLSPKQREEMFKNGGKWVNLEIINPKTQNVIPYNKNILVFHNTVEYDDAGNVVQLGQDEGAQLAQKIQKIGADKQKTYGIQGPQNIAFSDKTDNEYMARQQSYIDELDKIKNSANLSDNDSLGDYLKKQWQDRITTELQSRGATMSPEMKSRLVNRWALGDKSLNAREFKKTHPELVDWFGEIDGDINNINKKIRKPIEFLFLRVGADALVRMTNFISANNPAAADSLKKEVLTVIETLKADPSRASEALNKELERLEAIGFDKVVPTEGVVFMYGGKPYKLTGAFAPVNQLSSALKYGKVDTSAGEEGSTPYTGKTPVVVYPGRFQPFHTGHYSVYKSLVDKYGKDNVYIATSDKTDNTKSPFNFDEKQTIISKMFGVPTDKIVQVQNPYAPKEIVGRFPEDTPFITAFSEKDSDRLSQTGYFNRLPKNPQSLGGYRKVGYYTTVPEFETNVDGENILSATKIRTIMKDPTRSPEEKKKLFTSVYGKFDQDIFDLITNKLNATLAGPSPKVKKTPIKKTSVKKVNEPSSSPDKKSVLNKKVHNPETDRDILVKTALGYDRVHPAHKAAVKMLQSENIIIEGGNAVKVNSKIPNRFAQSSADYMAKKLGLSKLDRALVGSTHKPIMNDLDVAMDFEEVKKAIGFVGTDKKQFFTHLKSYLNNTGFEVNVQPGFQQFSIAAPLVNTDGHVQKAVGDDGKPTSEDGNIQIDFMMGDLTFMKHFLTNGDTSSVSSTYRNIFIMEILRNLIEDTDAPGVKSRYLINTRDGIYKETFTEKSNGKRETINKERISNDVDFLAKIMFGEDAKFADIDTFEKLTNRVVQPDVKFRDKLPNIVNQFKQTITTMKKELPAGIPDTSDPADIVQSKTTTNKMPIDKSSNVIDSKILNTKIRNPETDNNILVRTALKYDKTHPAHKAALKVVRNSKK